MKQQIKQQIKQLMFFANFPKTEAIENFAQSRLQRIFDKFTRVPFESSEMRFQVDNFPDHPGRDMFTCEIVLQTKMVAKPIVVRKTSDNLYNSIVAAAKTLREQLSKIHTRVTDHHVRRSRRLIPIDVPV